MRIRVRGRAESLAIVVFSSIVLAACGAGCADVLGLEEWSDPSQASGTASASSGAGGAGVGGAGGSVNSSHTVTTGSGPSGVGGDDGTCADGLKNGNQETDVDCGGDSCDPCDLGQGCNWGADCKSGVCTKDHTCGPPGNVPCEPGEGAGGEGPNETCNDCLANGDESDIDCGGDACLPCGYDKVCETSSDCISSHCGQNSRCSAGPTGAACKKGLDCASALCQGGPCWTGLCCK